MSLGNMYVLFLSLALLLPILFMALALATGLWAGRTRLQPPVSKTQGCDSASMEKIR